MSSLNKVMLIGRLGQDPDVRYTQSNTAVATLNIATSERYRDNNGEMVERTEWHRVVAWSKLAETVKDYMKKGLLVYVEGSLQTRQWEDKEGKKNYTTEIKANVITMLESKNARGGGDSRMADEPQAQSYSPKQAPVKIEAPVEDDDLPF